MSKITSDLSNLDCTIEILLGCKKKKKSKQITKQWSEKIEKETLMMVREYLIAARQRHMKVWDHLRLWTQTVTLFKGFCDAQQTSGSLLTSEPTAAQV